MQRELDDQLDARSLRVGIAVSHYHREVTESMWRAAVDLFVRCGGNQRDLHTYPAAGSFELTAVCRAMALARTRSGRPSLDAIVALGCIITGETTHDQHIAHSVTQGLTAITVQTGIPIAFGVLTCQTIEQALARSVVAAEHRNQNKGAEAMYAAIHAARTIAKITSARSLR